MPAVMTAFLMLVPTTILLFTPSLVVKTMVLYIFTSLCVVMVMGSRHPDPIASVATYAAFIIAMYTIPVD
jgi:hypothetical protein